MVQRIVVIYYKSSNLEKRKTLKTRAEKESFPLQSPFIIIFRCTMQTPEEEKILLAHFHEIIHRGYDIRKRADYVRYQKDLKVCNDNLAEGISKALDLENRMPQPLSQAEREPILRLQKNQAAVHAETDLIRPLIKLLAFRGELESQQAKQEDPAPVSTPIPVEEKISVDGKLCGDVPYRLVSTKKHNRPATE